MSGQGFQPKGKGSRKKKKPKTDAESGYSSSYAQLLGVLSEGDIEGPIEGLKGVYLNETPIQNADNSLNFTGVGYEFRAGTSTQTPIAGYGDEVTSEQNVNLEVKYNLPIVRAINNSNIDLIRVRLAFQLQEFLPDGSIRQLSITFRISIKEGLGGFVNRHEQTITARFSSPVELEYDFPVNNFGGTVSNFVVRVERLTHQDGDTTRFQKTLSFKAYAEVISTRLSYPFSALVGLRFDATQFDALPQAAFRIGGRLIQIPSNSVVASDRGLDYSGTWDGTFVIAPIACACPAWIFYDLVVNQRYGLGKYIDETKVDKWSIFELSKYCNDMVSIGANTFERRFQCHVLLESKEDATRVIDALRSIFRGFVYWMSGALQISADRPGTPAMIVSQADIENGMFTYNRTPLKQRHTIAHVTWLDKDNFYKRTIQTVEDQIGIERYGLRELEISAFGCTSQYQAHRAGWATILSERLELETVTFRIRPYGAYAVPGMIIKVMDIKRSTVRFGGLVAAATDQAITLDHPVTLTNSGLPYNLSLMTPDGSVIEAAIANPVGPATNVLVLTSPLATNQIPVVESPWLLTSIEVQPQLFRVIGIVPVAEETGLLYEISALEYKPGKYSAIDTDYYVPPAPPRAVPPPIPPAPLNLLVNLDDSFSVATGILSATWQAPQNKDFITGYYAEYRTVGGDWQGTQQVAFPSASWDVAALTYYVRVASIDVYSNTSAWVAYGPVTANYKIDLNLAMQLTILEKHRIQLNLASHIVVADLRPEVELLLGMTLTIGD